MRIEYLKSILRQEVGFFDKQTNSSTTFQVIATITSDAQTIQDTMSDKVHMLLEPSRPLTISCVPRHFCRENIDMIICLFLGS